MPKRTIDDRISEYNDKIRRLQEKKDREPPRKRIRIIYSSSDEDNIQDLEDINCDSSQDEVHFQNGQEAHVTEPRSPEVIVHVDPSQPPIQDDAQEASPCEELVPEPVAAAQQPEPQPSTSKSAAATSGEVAAEEEPVEPELLLALGEATDDIPEYGKAIHENLASLWLPLLKKGLQKENKEKLVKKYLIPDNCRLLQSPKLNAEISAAVSEIVRGRDKKLAGLQQQLGAGITAVNKGMETLLSSGNKAQALSYLSDSCRILTDLHWASTRDRIKLITPSLEKNILHVIQDSERDDTLFGNTLSEKIKASKAIVRQGQQIKNKTGANQTFTARQSTPYRYNQQGNWRGPPRFPTGRGGRGSHMKPLPTRRPYNYNTTTTKPASQAKPRAPTQQ